MTDRKERARRASAAARRRAEAAAPPRVEPFRVLIAAHRPRYRSRSERAVAIPGWEVRSLLNREDPVGLLQQKLPDILILTVDTQKNKNVGYLRAAQPFRPQGLYVIGIFETEEDAGALAGQVDAFVVPSWKAVDLRAIAAARYTAVRSEPIDAGALDEDDEEA